MNSQYLELLKKFKIVPNFFCSQEYFDKSEIEEKEDGDWVYWKQHNWAVCPPINKNDGSLTKQIPEGTIGVWSNFPNWALPIGYKQSFNDYEYIYSPKNFQDLEGSHWRVFRKNIKKFPGRYGKAPLRYMWIEQLMEKLGEHTITDTLKSLLIGWISSLGEDRIIEDDAVMVKYILEGNRRKVLVDKDYTILGLNIWDHNHHYINFRYCLTGPHKFLSEYIRFLFYSDPIILDTGKLVNDGGVLGNKLLEDFKDKLNPINKREVYSHIL